METDPPASLTGIADSAVCMPAMAPRMLGLGPMVAAVIVIVVIRDDDGRDVPVVASDVTVGDHARAGHGRRHREGGEHDGDHRDAAENAGGS